MLLPGNNLHLQRIRSSEIDIVMIFIDFLEIGGEKIEFLGSISLLVGSQQIPGLRTPGESCDTQGNRIN